MKSGKEATIKATEHEPIVFVNRPISDKKDDIVGFSTQVGTICEAIQGGATMIGVVADYGSGKSSMTELLGSTVIKKPYRYPKPIIINMWDCLITGKKPGEEKEQAEQEVSELTKTFLYQLANGNARHRYLGSYINKRLSRNYGNISFSVGSGIFWLLFILAGVFYTIYAILSNANAAFDQVLQSEKLLRIVLLCRAFSPAFLFIALLFAAFGVINTCVVFSHWKMQSARKVEVNDVFDVYAQIVKRVKPRGKNKKQLIVVEDLDRVADKAIIVGFLKELYRFRSSMQNSADRFVFIVAIKPEAKLKSQLSQLTIDDDKVYSKLFDTVIPLKPIHFEDYDAILLKLINGDPEKKNRLQKLIGEPITDTTLPKSFYWIKKGSNLTLRDLKDRLNHAIMIMTSRQSYKVRTSVTFEACAAVTYLESTYPGDYNELIANEGAFARLMSRSVDIINVDMASQETTDSVHKALKNEVQIQFLNNTFQSSFVDDLCTLIQGGVFNYDFRMYFYTYPSGSHIKTTEERELCDMLLLPSRYKDYSCLEAATTAVYGKDFNYGMENVVTDTLVRLEKFPKVVLMDERLLRVAGTKDWGKTAASADKFYIQTMASDDEAVEFWKRVHNVDFENKSIFVDYLQKELIAIVSKPDAVELRSCIIEGYAKDILEFQKIFSSGRNPKVPQVSEEEIALIDDIDISIQLIDTRKLTQDNFLYISDLLCRESLSENSLKKALDIMKRYAKLAPQGFDGKALTFLGVNGIADDDIFMKIYQTCDKQELALYINALPPQALSEDYLDGLDILGLDQGLSEHVLRRLLERKEYTCVLLSAANADDFRMIDDQLDNVTEIVGACEKIAQEATGRLVKIRWHLCVEEADRRYFVLYEDQFPLITEAEYAAIESVGDAIDCLDLEKADKTNCAELLKIVTTRKYDDGELLALLRKLFDVEQYGEDGDNADVPLEIAESLDFGNFELKNRPVDIRDEVYGIVCDSLEEAEPALSDRMRRLGAMTPAIERLLSEQDPTEYCGLINEFDELTPYTMEWLTKHYLNTALSERLSAELKAAGDYRNYIVSSVLRKRDMIMEEDVPFDDYLDVYLNVPEMYDIMSNHWMFLEGLEKEQRYERLYEDWEGVKYLRSIYKVPQHAAFIRFMLSDKFSNQERTEYLAEMGEFASEHDCKEFSLIICEPQNIELLNSRQKYIKVYEKIQQSGRKATLTRRWNERWGAELGTV